jgi:hypothetical protein
MAPTENFWHVVIVEDADRIREEAEPVLLKALEEPPPHTVWILCAPSAEDITPTIASRTRHVALSTPTTADVTGLLVEAYGIDQALAAANAFAPLAIELGAQKSAAKRWEKAFKEIEGRLAAPMVGNVAMFAYRAEESGLGFACLVEHQVPDQLFTDAKRLRQRAGALAHFAAQRIGLRGRQCQDIDQPGDVANQGQAAMLEHVPGAAALSAAHQLARTRGDLQVDAQHRDDDAVDRGINLSGVVDVKHQPLARQSGFCQRSGNGFRT